MNQNSRTHAFAGEQFGEAAFTEACTQGRKLTVDDAIAFAFDALG